MKKLLACLVMLFATVLFSVSAFASEYEQDPTNINANLNGNLNRNINGNLNANKNANKNTAVGIAKVDSRIKNSQGQLQGQLQGQKQSANNKQGQYQGANNKQAQSANNKQAQSANNKQAQSANNKQGQSANNKQGQSNEITIQDNSVYEAQKRDPVSSAIAPNLVTGGDDICLGSTSAGAQGVGFGVSFGSTTQDDNCVMIKQTKLLSSLGLKNSAIARMCANADMAQAMKADGHCETPAVGGGADDGVPLFEETSLYDDEFTY